MNAAFYSNLNSSSTTTNYLGLNTTTSNNNNLMKSTLLNMFSIEQWELMRRLKNSGLSKEQICLAYDGLGTVIQDYATPLANLNTLNGQHQLKAITNQSFVISDDLPPSTIVNEYFGRLIKPEKEKKELQMYRARGDLNLQKEISLFVIKNDLKQSQIARMAGVNQAYVSKFLRGDFGDLSENSKNLIFKWYLRFLKNSSIFRKPILHGLYALCLISSNLIVISILKKSSSIQHKFGIYVAG